MERSFTFIVPALDEESNIAATVQEIESVAGNRFSEYEIVLIDDGSSDRTPSIMDRLAVTDPRLVVVHHPRNLGLGAAYRRGVQLARFDHLMLVPGDNQFPGTSMALLLDQLGRADIVLQYTVNPQIRPLGRRLLSAGFTALVNTLFGLSLRYYNGTVVHRTGLVKTVRMTTDGFAYQAEILVRLIARGASYVEVGVPITERSAGRSAALGARNVTRVLETLARLFLEVRLGFRSSGP
ncbi:MAG: glycosyltransferase family 2 protein [Candidatus Riflebacteria bacterium]|nr:glycosyltransferase family 2 protein [Candidatus Riflebacteria bacterium]